MMSSELHPHQMVPLSQPELMLMPKPQQLMQQLSKPQQPVQRLLLRQQLPHRVHRVQASATGWCSPPRVPNQRRLRQRLPAVR